MNASSSVGPQGDSIQLKARRVFPVVALVGLGGALATIVGLLVRGVDVAKWKEQDRAFAG